MPRSHVVCLQVNSDLTVKKVDLNDPEDPCYKKLIGKMTAAKFDANIKEVTKIKSVCCLA